MPNKKNGVPFDKIDKIFKIEGASVHFVGVNGVSMSSLAKLAMLLGANVSGSDRDLGTRCTELANGGAHIYAGHSPDHIHNGINMVVYSNAITEENIELQRAEELSIPTISRARFMGALMMGYGLKIGISGTHGKSTTTAMIDAIFTKAGKNPTTLSGEDLPGTGSSLRIGGKENLIYEACEYKDAFQMFTPNIAIALNLEMDHVDYYKDESQLKNSFAKALSRASNFVLLNEDDENLFKIKKKIGTRIITFGTAEQSDYRYSIISFGDSSYTFSLVRNGKTVGVFKISTIGAFNVVNAAAAAIVALECGIKPAVIEDVLRDFSGIKRRLEYVGKHQGRPVIYDYAHHPTEIRSSLNAIKASYSGETTVIFKPHTYTRTQYFWRELRSALEIAEHIILTDIYPARENPIAGVTSENLAAAIGSRAIYAKESEIMEIVDIYTNGTIVVMGAGDLSDIKDRLIASDQAAKIKGDK